MGPPTRGWIMGAFGRWGACVVLDADGNADEVDSEERLLGSCRTAGLDISSGVVDMMKQNNVAERDELPSPLESVCEQKTVFCAYDVINQWNQSTHQPKTSKKRDYTTLSTSR